MLRPFLKMSQPVALKHASMATYKALLPYMPSLVQADGIDTAPGQAQKCCVGSLTRPLEDVSMVVALGRICGSNATHVLVVCIERAIWPYALSYMLTISLLRPNDSDPSE
jgi:hypothetical protein